VTRSKRTVREHGYGSRPSSGRERRAWRSSARWLGTSRSSLVQVGPSVSLGADRDSTRARKYASLRASEHRVNTSTVRGGSAGWEAMSVTTRSRLAKTAVRGGVSSRRGPVRRVGGDVRRRTTWRRARASSLTTGVRMLLAMNSLSKRLDGSSCGAAHHPGESRSRSSAVSSVDSWITRNRQCRSFRRVPAREVSDSVTRWRWREGCPVGRLVGRGGWWRSRRRARRARRPRVGRSTGS